MYRHFQQMQMMDSTTTGHASSAQVAPTTSDSGTLGPLWLLDSGASLHMMPDAIPLTSCHSASPITHIRIADGSTLPVTSTGHLHTSTFSVPSVSHVFRLSMSLMSVSQLTYSD